MEKKALATPIILSIVTCFLYTFYWIYKIADALEKEGGPCKFNPMVSVLLCWFVPVIGPVLVAMGWGEAVNRIREKRGLATVDNNTMYIIMGLITTPAIALAIYGQMDINKIVDGDAPAA